MANDASTNPFVYDRLSFPGYYLHRPCLDTEWLLSTLFDASLLSTSKAAGNGGSFFAISLHRHSGMRPTELGFTRVRHYQCPGRQQPTWMAQARNDGRLETIFTVAAGLSRGRAQ